MPSLLDQRPIPRRPPIFGQALVAQQRAEQEQANRAQRAGEFAVREGRMAEAQATRAAQNEAALALRERAVALAEKIQGAKLTAVEMQLKRKEMQASAFTKAMKQIGAVAADDAEAEVKIASILADNAAALDEDNTELSGMLKERVSSLQKNILDFRSVAQKRDEEMEKRRLAGEQANAAVAMGMKPEAINTSTGGIQFRAPEAGNEKFPSYEAARAKYPNAAIRGVTDPTGAFIIEGISSTEPKATGATALMGQTPTAAPDRNALAQRALDDPNASEAHKAAARKILGL